MAGIENCLRPQTTRVLAAKERAQRAARLARYDDAAAELHMDPDVWLDTLTDRPDADDSLEAGAP